MAVLKTRNRLVNFRLTQEELESLKMACLVTGSRNLSDFARGAVLESIGAHTEPGMLIQGRLATLDTKVTEIGVTIQFMTELLKGTLKGLAQVPRRDPSVAPGREDPAGARAPTD